MATPGRLAWAAVRAACSSRRCPAPGPAAVDVDPWSGGKAHRIRRDRPLFKQMSFAVGTLALVLFVGAGTSVYAQDQQNNQPANPPASSGATTQDQQSGQTATPQAQPNGADVNGRRSRRERMRDNTMRGSDMTTGSSVVGTSRIDWSERYRLTPIEHKRLRAMGLSDDEVFAVSNASEESGVDVDEITQMVLRGRDYFQIAEQL